MIRLITLFTYLITIVASAESLYIKNVKGYSFDQNERLQQFSSILIEQGKVVALDPTAEQIQGSKKVDGKAKVMLPGLIDAHGHLLGLGNTLLQVDVRDVKSAQQTARKVQEYAKEHGDLEWIRGRGWNQVLWPGKQFPTAVQLDEYVKNKPVWLERVDGHAGWANSRALELAGISADTIDPPGGKILRDENGQPSGVLIDNAMALLKQHIPTADKDFYQSSMNAASSHLLSLGITSMHDAGISAKVYDFYQDLANNNALQVRIYAMLSAADPEIVRMLDKGYIKDKRDFLSIRSVKAYGDGALGSRGAALLAPYSDAKHNSGLLVTRLDDVKPLFDLVLGKKFQLNYHAIGDRANRIALDQFADSFERIGGKSLRHRVEHTQVVDLEDIPRFKQLDIIPAMQPTHATSDMNMAQDRLGKARLKGAYAWQTFLKQGSRLAFGSDFPVELANPFYGLHAAVTRQNRQNQPEGGWIPEEAMNIEQAFKAFTWDAAYAAHQDTILGGLSKGKWADFILVDQDIFKVSPQDIWKTRVLETWVAGEKVFVATK